MKFNNLLQRFLVWRVKNISNKSLVLFLSIFVGAFSGLGAVILKTTTHYIQHLLTQGFQIEYLNYLYFAYPLIGILLTIAFVIYLNKGKLGHGLSNILYIISRKSSLVERDKTYSHVVTSTLTVGFGGSVGLEAPIVVTGSAIGSNVGRFMHLGYKNRTLLIGCGAAAAIAAIFNAPITGVVFTLEVLLLELAIPSFIPILLAAISGKIVSKLLLGEDILFYFDVQADFLIAHIPHFIALGILTGLVSIYFSRVTHRIEEYFLRFKGRLKKGLIGGFFLGVLILLFPPLYGEGFGSIKSILGNNPAELLNNSIAFSFADQEWVILLFISSIILFKVLAMTFTISGGGNGGYFAPSLFVGALTGFIFARVLSNVGIIEANYVSNFSLVGMAGIISGVLHAPLTGIFLIAEITNGYELIVPLMIVSVISYATIIKFEPHSIYTKQLVRKGELLTRNKDKAILSNLKLNRVIETDLKTVKPDMNLGELAEVVAHSKRNIFPVVDEDGVLLGIILLDDIRHIMFKQEKYESTFAKELMHSPPAFVTPNEDMDSVMQKFQMMNAWNLPVLEEGKYIGFVSKAKIFSVYRRLLIHFSKE